MLERLIAGTEDEHHQEDQACFWYCSSKRAVMTSTNRQELRDYTFSTTSQIGLEVEAVDEKVLICLRIYSKTVLTLFCCTVVGGNPGATG
jgi:hypothetical protein